MGKYNVLSVGAATIDAFLSIDEVNMRCRLNSETGELCVKYGEKISVNDCKFLLGGNGSNIAVGLSRLGFKTALCIEIGDDEFSHKITTTLAKEGVDISHIKKIPNSSSSFAMGLNFHEERTLFVQHVVREHDFILDGIETEWIYLTSLGKEWKGAYRKVIDFAKKNNMKLAFNPGTLQIKDASEEIDLALMNADIIFVNREEAYTLIHGDHIDHHHENEEEFIIGLLKSLQKKGAKQVVITNGKKGSYVADSDGKVYHFDVYPGNIIERTGGGDAYAAGFLSALIDGLDVSEAMKWGTANAGSVIEHIGAQGGLLTKDKLLERINQHTTFTTREVKI